MASCRRRRSSTSRAITLATSQERGLLSVAFAPDYATTGRFYVYVTVNAATATSMTNGEIQIREYRRSMTNPEPRGPAQRPLAALDPAQPGLQPQRRSGADRAGREAVAGDRRRRRLEQPVRTLAEPELAARQAAAAGSGRRDCRRCSRVGLRNPWRFSFMPDGQIVIADVGQNQYEEINVGLARELRLAVSRGRCTTSCPTRAATTSTTHDPVAREDPQRPRVLLDHRRLRRARPGPAHARRAIHLRRLLQRRPAIRRAAERDGRRARRPERAAT